MKKISLIVAACLFFNFVNAQQLLSGLPVSNYPLQGILPVGDTVYVWGDFTQFGDSSRTYLASFNIHTGMVTAWNPVPNLYINGVTQVGNHLVVTGMFDSIAGQYRLLIAMFNLRTGNLESWADTGGSATNFTKPIGVDGSNFYFFNTENYQIIRANADSGVTSSWRTAPLTYGTVNTICVSDSFVYVGGVFNELSGFYFLRRYYKANAELDTLWNPAPDGNSFQGVIGIGINKYQQLFVAGQFDTIAGQPRSGIAGFDATGHITDFNPDMSSTESLSLAVDDNDIWLGCNSHLIGGQYRWRLGEIDIASGTATCWDASATTENWSFCYFVNFVGDTVYASNYSNTVYVFTGSPRPHPGPNVIQGPTSSLPGQQATYSVPDSTGFTYSWLISGGTGHSIADSIVITWGNGPLGVIKMVENNNNYSTCSSDTIQVLVSIATCAATADSISGPTNLVNNQTAIYTVPNTPGLRYIWNVTGGTGSSTSDSITVTWGTDSSGTISLLETNDSIPSCAGDSLVLQVSLAPAGIQNFSQTIPLSVFPNPFTDKVRIEAPAGGTLKLYDMAGSILLQQAITSATFEIDMQAYSKGVYVLLIEQGNSKQRVMLIKQ